mgnify:CR=1 FL=1
MKQVKEYLAVPNLSELNVLEWAQSILETRFKRSNYLTNPSLVGRYLKAQLVTEEREVFALILLDSQHGVLTSKSCSTAPSIAPASIPGR